MAARGRDRRPPPRHGQTSDLGPRILVAIPALAFAGVIVGFGDWVFTAGLFLLGAVCLHELFDMYAFTHPTRLGGLIGLAGLLVAAQAGDRATVLLAFVACVPVVFLLCLAQPRPAGMPGVSVTMLGLTWVGLALAHGVMLRDLEHGNAIVINVLVGTFVGDSGAYLGGRMLGVRKLAPSISPNKTVEGLLGRVRGRHRRGLVRRAVRGLAQRRRRADPRRGDRRRRAARRPVRELPQARRRREGHRRPVRRPRRRA